MRPETTHQDEHADTGPRRGTQVPTRWLAYASLGASGCFTVCVIALHLLEPGFNPLDHAMSVIAHGAQGWLVTIGFLALGLGSLALTSGFARTLYGRSARIGLWCLAIWGICGLVGGIFPDDLPGHWNAPSLSGSLHASAAQIGTVVLAIAALLLAWSVRRDPRWHRSARLLLTLAITTVVGLVILELSFLPVLLSAHPPILFGLLERIFFVTAISWLVVAAIGLLQTMDDTTTSMR